MADSNSSDFKQDITSAGFYVMYIVALLLMGYYSFTAGKGAEEQINFVKLTVYSIPLIAYALFVITIKIGRKWSQTLQKIYVFVHDPEYGALNSIKLFRNPFQLLIFSLVLFSILGLIGATVKVGQNQSGIENAIFPLVPGSFQQQVTPTAKLTFSLFGAPAENAILYVLLAFIVTIEMIIAHKNGWDKKLTYLVAILPNAIVAGTLWLVLHNLISGGNEVGGIAYWLFGFNGAWITLLTGSIISFDTYHIFNNLFKAIKAYFGSELLIFVFIAIISIVIIGGIIYFTRKKKAGSPAIMMLALLLTFPFLFGCSSQPAQYSQIDGGDLVKQVEQTKMLTVDDCMDAVTPVITNLTNERNMLVTEYQKCYDAVQEFDKAVDQCDADRLRLAENKSLCERDLSTSNWLIEIFQSKTTHTSSGLEHAVSAYGSDVKFHFDQNVFIIGDGQKYWVSCETDSMNPTLGCHDDLIAYVPDSSSEIHVGDIIAFTNAKGVHIIHRVISYDSVTKRWETGGDSTTNKDKGSISFSDIDFKIVGVVYAE
jgi:hypothetical protein